LHGNKRGKNSLLIPSGWKLKWKLNYNKKRKIFLYSLEKSEERENIISKRDGGKDLDPF
jgi:hypothetical protein